MNSKSIVVRAARALVVLGAVSAGLLVATAASADPPNLKLPPILTCEQIIDGTLADFAKPNSGTVISAPTSLMLGEDAFGSARGGRNRLRRVGSKLAGTVTVGQPVGEPPPGTSVDAPLSKTVAVEIFRGADGKATMKWVVDGVTYQSTVDSCASRIFTASLGRSAIIVRVGPVSLNVPQ